jgi:hypothetical protein
MNYFGFIKSIIEISFEGPGILNNYLRILFIENDFKDELFALFNNILPYL